MSDPTIAVQLAIMARLRTGVTATGQRVYDAVDSGATYPYLTVTSPSTVPIDEECWDRSDMRFQIDVWSKHPQSHEAKTIAATIRDLFHEQDLPLTGFVVDRIYVDGIFPTREEQTAINRVRIVLAVEAQPA